jgi:hypothetical protein
MRLLVSGLMIAGLAAAQNPPQPIPAPPAPSAPAVTSLAKIKRVYVEALAGDDSAEAIRQLIISTLQQSHLFLVTDNPDRADVTLRGAANDTAFTDTFDTQDSINSHGSGGGFSGRTSSSNRTSGSGIFGGSSAGDSDSQHIRERKHEAYATVRLCNRDGDVLWATTQESRGAKFHGASADVAQKVTHQLQADFAKAVREKQKPVDPADSAPDSNRSGSQPDAAQSHPAPQIVIRLRGELAPREISTLRSGTSNRLASNCRTCSLALPFSGAA